VWVLTRWRTCDWRPDGTPANEAAKAGLASGEIEKERKKGRKEGDDKKLERMLTL